MQSCGMAGSLQSSEPFFITSIATGSVHTCTPLTMLHILYIVTEYSGGAQAGHAGNGCCPGQHLEPWPHLLSLVLVESVQMGSS